MRSQERGRVRVRDAPVIRELLHDADDAQPDLAAALHVRDQRPAEREAEALGEALSDLGLAARRERACPS